MTADRSPAPDSPRSTTRRRLIIGAALLPLLGLAACGYGSEKTDTTTNAAASGSASGKKLSASEVKIGYFANLTHGTALVGLAENGPIREVLGATSVKTSVFNAGPAEIEALNAGSIDIGWIGPSPPSTAM